MDQNPETGNSTIMKVNWLKKKTSITKLYKFILLHLGKSSPADDH